MCLVSEVGYTACAHNKHLLLEVCPSGWSVASQNCNTYDEQVTRSIPSLESPYCGACYLNTLGNILDDYKYSAQRLHKETWSLGWDLVDTQGSLQDIKVEAIEAIREWKMTCGRGHPTTAWDPTEQQHVETGESELLHAKLINLRTILNGTKSSKCHASTNPTNGLGDFDKWLQKQNVEGKLDQGKAKVDCAGEKTRMDKLEIANCIDNMRKNTGTVTRSWRSR